MKTAAQRSQGIEGRGVREFRFPRPSRVLSALLLIAGFAALGCHATRAEAADRFMGIAVAPSSGSYVARQDVTVRKEPKNDGARTITLKKGERVEGVGKAPYGWIALRKEGRDIGFVFSQALMPLIDGEVGEELTGSAPAKGGSCAYTIRFVGKSPVENEVFETSDYEVSYRCRLAGRTIDVAAFMFIAEAPFEQSDVPDFQVNLDLPDISAGDEVMSTIFRYRQGKGEVTFDSVALDAFGMKPQITGKPAKTVAEALRAVVELAPGCWNDAAWKALVPLTN